MLQGARVHLIRSALLLAWGTHCAATGAAARSASALGGAGSRLLRAYSALRAMVLYELVVLTKTKAATAQLGPLLKSCCNTIWKRGGLVADINSWGSRELAYRIRKQGENFHHAQYLSIWTHCAPRTLREVEATLRTSDMVLRWMPLRRPHAPRLPEEVRHPGRHQRIDPPDLAADAAEAAKYEYRNLVMQRVFEGKPRQELLAEQLTRHKMVTHFQRFSDRAEFENPRPDSGPPRKPTRKELAGKV